MQYTENLELPLFETDDPVDLFSTYNAAMGTIDEAIEAAGQTAMDAKSDATIAIGDAAAADRKAMAAQTDATQALADAETAGQTATTADQKADQALTDAAAASALAQQAIASGLKFKQLSNDEINSILSLSGATDGFGNVTSSYVTNPSYVINITPRIKFVSISVVRSIKSTFVLNTNYKLRYVSSPPKIEDASYSIYTNIDCIPVIFYGHNENYSITFEGSGTIPSGINYVIIKLNGIITYNSDTDLGTDIA